MTPSPYWEIASSRISKRLALSYVVDWIVILGIVAVGAAFWQSAPYHRPFSPVDPSISYPVVENAKVSSAVLVVVSLIAPGIITAAIALIFMPGPTVSKDTPRSQIWRLKLWEWNTAWMGLGLALATTFLFTEGMKNIFGKPRPDLLSRCNLDPATVQQYAVGGYGAQLPEWNLLVSSKACRQPDSSRLDNGFQSFPSGHSSYSFAGMVYLALYLCSKFAITIPYLLPLKNHTNTASASLTVDPTVSGAFVSSPRTSLRKEAAAPPTWTLVLPLFLVSVAIYISSTRFTDYRHHGFDILFGSLLGVGLSWSSFRLYHLPIRTGAGWSWGPRSASRAWYIGAGVASYVVEEQDRKRDDAEVGHGPVDGSASARKPFTNDVEGLRPIQQ